MTGFPLRVEQDLDDYDESIEGDWISYLMHELEQEFRSRILVRSANRHMSIAGKYIRMFHIISDRLHIAEMRYERERVGD